MKKKTNAVWSPWYHALRAGDHYRALCPGTKIEECTPANRNPNCTICKEIKDHA